MSNPVLEQAVNADLLALRAMFQAKGFDIRIVGGAVRDILQGQAPKDIDLCTDAFPDEQQAIYSENGLKHIPTGVEFGTWTVVLNNVSYEITSLRTESEHDGRHAKMAWTRDWVDDLSRRDLTYNAMAMTFDGELIDPFNGHTDLLNKVTRFVGKASERLREDHLRILRFFRFLGRTGFVEIDKATEKAIEANTDGLQDVSAERIWVEVKKILTHDTGPQVYKAMHRLKVTLPARLPRIGTRYDSLVEVHRFTRNPVTILCSLLEDYQIDGVADALRWGIEERQLAKIVCKYREMSADDVHFAAYVDGVDKDALVEVLRYQGMPFVADGFALTPVPVFPMTGKDLISAGHKPGPQIGEMLRKLKIIWFNSGCRMTKGELWGHHGS